LIKTRDELGAALTTLRQRAGLTVRSLASRTNIPTATADGYLRGKHLPSPTQIGQFRAILIACGVDETALGRWEGALARVRSASDGRAGGGRPRRRTAGEANPYRGLQPFESQHAALFFGREEFVAGVLARLTGLRDTLQEGPRLMFIVGASGAGKSSVLRAGIVPAVLAGRLGGDEAWSVPLMVPGGDPVAALDEALAGAATPTLLIVDQFEELYTLTGEAEQERFVERLTTLGPDTLVIAGLRADFFPNVANDPVLVRALQEFQLVVPPLSESELRATVLRPPATLGVTVDDALVELLLSDVVPTRRPATGVRHHVLPLLSHALLSAWEHRDPGPLTVHAYRAAGGLRGAVQQSAEQAYEELDSTEAELVRRMFLRLVNVDEDFVITRRRIAREELLSDDLEPTTMDDVLERFVVRRLITADDRSLEISHDALLTAWPRLADWIAADHAGLLMHRRLTAAANAWHAAGADGHLLWRGSALAGAEGWAGDPDHRRAMNRTEREFLAAGVAAREAERRDSRRRVRTLRRLVAGLAVLLLIALVSAGYAFRASRLAAMHQHRADLARDDALSRQVAIEAMRALDTDPALAEQLALASYRISATVDARSALLDTTAAGIVHRLLGASGPTVVRLNPAGTVLAVSNAADGTVGLYRYAAGRPGARLAALPAQSASDQVFALTYSPDGRTVAVGGLAGRVRLFDVTDPAHPALRSAVPEAFTGAVEGIAFNPAGTQLAAVGSGPSLRTWAAAPDTGWQRPVAQAALTGSADSDVDQAVAYSPDGRLLATGGTAGALQLWRTDGAGGPASTVRVGTSTINALTFAPDGSSVLVGAKNGDAVIVPLPDGTQRRLDTGFITWVNAVAYSPDGALVAVGGSDSAIDVFDARTAAPMDRIASESPVTALMYTADGRVLLAAAADGTVRTFPARRRAIGGPSGPIFALGYDRSGRWLTTASSGDAGTVSLWSITSAPPGQLWSPLHAASLNPPAWFGAAAGSVAISPDGRLLAAANRAGRLLLTSVNDAGAIGPEATALDGATKLVEAIVFSPDQHVLAASSDDGYVRMWDVRAPASPHRLPDLESGGEAAAIAFSPNGRYLAAASVDRRVHLWDVGTPEHPRELPALTGFENYAWSVTFSPDSTVIAAGGADDTIRLWRIDDPEHPHALGPPLTGPSHYVNAVAFSPDGRTLTAAGGDGSVWMWRITPDDAPQPILALHTANQRGHTYAIGYSPDGRTLAAAGSTGEVVFWDADPDTVAAAICAYGGDRLTRPEWTRYIPGAAYRPLCD